MCVCGPKLVYYFGSVFGHFTAPASRQLVPVASTRGGSRWLRFMVLFISCRHFGPDRSVSVSVSAELSQDEFNYHFRSPTLHSTLVSSFARFDLVYFKKTKGF